MISPEILRRYPYFAGIHDESLKQLAMIAEVQRFPAAARIFNEGDPADTLSIIAKGEVEVQYRLGNGELRTVDTLVEGDILGWSALIAPYKITAHCTATKPTELVRLNAQQLRGLCDQDPRLGYQLTAQIAKLLGHRLEGARVQLAVV
jgi:CRP/FNR family transcriptional regulator, cyclic AMP receptor protein